MTGRLLRRWPGADLPGELAPRYDVVIVGAGIVGCALAHELSHDKARVLLLDRHLDVGEGTSKANSAIIHTGFDQTPGTLEASLVVDACKQWPTLARRLKIPFRQTSAMVLALDEEQASRLPELQRQAISNGVDDIEILSAEVARAREPAAPSNICGALHVVRESIIDPFAASIAFCELALSNGVDVVLGAGLRAVRSGAWHQLELDGGATVEAKSVVNVAGLGSRKVADLYGGAAFDLVPRRGQFLIYDSFCGSRLQHILLPIPTKRTKGMLVTPTIFGNILAGPTAEDLPEGTVTAQTTAEGLAAVRSAASRMCPSLGDQPPIASYAGLRCHSPQGSYQIRANDGAQGLVTVTGIRSTGLTSSPALAQYLRSVLRDQCGISLERKARSKRTLAANDRPEWCGAGAEGRFDGALVCHCEQVSRGAILAALERPSKPRTLDAIKRRTRAMTGRCQGFGCAIPVAAMLADRLQTDLHQVPKRMPSTAVMDQVQGVAKRSAAVVSSACIGSSYDVAIIGAGPAGIGVAVGLQQRGVRSVLLVERAEGAGGVPRHYRAHRGGVPTFVDWTRARIVQGEHYASQLQAKLGKTHSTLWTQSQVVAIDRASRRLTIVTPTDIRSVEAKAIVFATGGRERTVVERGWIGGDRPGRVYQTMQLLHGLARGIAIPQQPVVIGSDVVAYAVAAKLKAAGAKQITLIDRTQRAQSRWSERLFFRRWVKPRTIFVQQPIRLVGGEFPREVRSETDQLIASCDAVFVAGELVANSELLAEHGLVDPMRRPDPVSAAERGWFVVGNALGGFRGAQWCYWHGMRVAGPVARYLVGKRSD